MDSTKDKYTNRIYKKTQIDCTKNKSTNKQIDSAKINKQIDSTKNKYTNRFYQK